VRSRPIYAVSILNNQPQTPESQGQAGASPAKQKHTQAQQLVRLLEGASLFHTPEKKGFVGLPVGSHEENYEISSIEVRRWMTRMFYKREGKPPTLQAIDSAMRALEAKAIFDKPEIPVHVRLASHGAAIYLDLADEGWLAVRTTAEGWKPVTNPPVRFRRPSGSAKLPLPQRGGTIDDLRPFINVRDDDSWKLLVGWLVAAHSDPRGHSHHWNCTGLKGLPKPPHHASFDP
jgi:hypothetical protein